MPIRAAFPDAREGRATPVIAHRLSMIGSADMICVIRQGRVLERGMNQNLMHGLGFRPRLKSGLSGFKHEPERAALYKYVNILEI